MELYKRLTDECLRGWNLIVKAHPRDSTDYTAAFPEAVILDKNMPSEMLRYALPVDVKSALSFPPWTDCRRTGEYIKFSVKG